jgi:hypothetical protein
MTEKDVNEYLYYEFGIDGDASSISDDWPFHLQSVGSLQLRGQLIEFYEFTDEETDYYAQEGFYFPKAGMILDDLYFQSIGEQWISEQGALDLDTTIIGDDQVPSLIERRSNIEALAKKALGDSAVFNVAEGLFFRKTNSYLALLENDTPDYSIVVGTDLYPISVGFPEATSFRRLSYAVGKFLLGQNLL